MCLRSQISVGWVRLLPLAVFVSSLVGRGWFLHRQNRSSITTRAAAVCLSLPAARRRSVRLLNVTQKNYSAVLVLV